MKIREAIRLVAGSVVVYGAVVACGAAADQLEQQARDDAGESPADGSGSSGGGSILDAIADAITNPEKDADAEQQTSGSRLKAEYLRGADGSRQFLRWFDLILQEPCTYLTDKFGEQRCMPTDRIEVPASALAWSNTASCTDAPDVVRVPAGYSYAYAAVREPSGNHSIRRLEPYTGLIKTPFVGSCQSEASVPTNETRYRLLAELPPADLVKGTIERD